MLPIEIHHADPSCSSTKASDLVGGLEAPKFSIRDYVFKCRRKDIQINWPFPEKLLQLCMDNGISNLLPPFEPSKTVRAHCFRKEVEIEQLPMCSENKQISEINGEPDEDVALKWSLPLNSSVVVSSEQSQPSFQKEKREFLMASKVCPVCKSFTSSSNTTLNAHIDRCLSSNQSNATMDVIEHVKSKVKPRKKRLMVDIYTTAPHCTLEELHRRNGTNWASDLSLVAPLNVTASLETKRTKISASNAVNRGNLGDIYVDSNGMDTNWASDLSLVAPINDTASLKTKRTKISASDTVNQGNVGDIYVDSNGMKILILSKFDDSSPSVSRKNCKQKTNGKRLKTSRIKCLMAEKKSSGPKYSEFMKDDTQKKKLRIAKGFNDEIESANGGYKITDAQKKKEESLSHLLSAREQVKISEPTILGHWARSKRSNLSRKLGNRVDISKQSEKIVVGTRKQSSTEKVERSYALISPKTKRLNILSNIEKSMDGAEKSSPKQSNSNSKSLPEGNSILAFGHMGEISSHSDSRPSSLKTRESSISKKYTGLKRTPISIEPRRFESEKLIKRKKLQKHRSISRCSKWLGGKSYSNFDLISSRANDANENHQEQRSSGSVTAAVAHYNNLDLDPIPEEHEESISRNESHLESPSQRSEQIQEIGNEIISQDSQESLLTTSERAQANNQDCNKIGDVESSGSPLSSTTVISSPSVGDNKVIDSDMLRSSIVRKDNKLKKSVEEPLCSCSDGLSREFQFTNHIRKKMSSNLFVKTSSLSSFRGVPNIDSPTESVIMMASSKSSINCSIPSSQPMTQAASNPVLRLMGKDLVVNKEEIPKIFPCDDSEYSNENFVTSGIPNYLHYQRKSNSIDRMVAPLQQWQKPANSSCLAHDLIVIDDKSHNLEVIDDKSHTFEAKPWRNFTSLPQTISCSNLTTSQRLLSGFSSQYHCANSEGSSEWEFVGSRSVEGWITNIG